ncbi:MAG: hypothetical protein ACHQLA_08760, partial [Ignavibacteriales bacterium]
LTSVLQVRPQKTHVASLMQGFSTSGTRTTSGTPAVARWYAEKFRKFYFQLDETADVTNFSQLLTYIRYEQEQSVEEDFFVL